MSSATIMQNHHQECGLQDAEAVTELKGDIPVESVFNFDFSALEVGDVVDCFTKIGVFKGEVLTFDNEIKVLVLRDTSEPRPQIRLINIIHIESVSF